MSFTNDDLPPIPPLDEKRATPPKTKWRPAPGDLVGIAGLVLAVAVYLTQPNWEIGAVLAILAVALIVFAAARHDSHVLWRVPIAAIVIIGFVAIIWRPLWAGFRKDYPHAAFNWPITLIPPTLSPPPPSNPLDMPPTNLPGPPLSRWGNAMFMCPYLPNVSDQDRVAARALYRRNAEIYGKALNVDIVLSDVAYGIRIDVTARGSEGQVRMAGILRYTIQMESASEGIFVTISMELPGALSILGQLPLERGSDIQKTWESQLEKLGFPSGQCRLL